VADILTQQNYNEKASQLSQYKKQLQAASKKVGLNVDALFQTSFYYDTYTPEIQNLLDNVLKNIDYSSLDYTEFGDLSTWLSDGFIKSFNTAIA